ncbi:zinc finger MYM-type protein 1-like [Ixodes scapularis]|uniref:zinc finger MYM-type protein 1-like n=1 Tax=Ixodes scapularis TaxID=6945 RepID=UPI001A9E7546|nr:zinc finger MYM-type protein 1-like [Ixodes scapularis]
MASSRPISDFFQRKGTKRKVQENVTEPEPAKEKLSLDEECVLNASAGEQECESTFGDSDGDGPDDEFQIEELRTRAPDILKVEIPPDVARTAHDLPVQPVLISFIVTKYGNDGRTFKSEWYTSFPWLEYSVTSNSAFCFACQMFSTSNGQRSGSAVFVTEGYRNWKKALQKDGKLRLHSNSAAHKLCQASWEFFKQMKEKGAENSVAVHLSEAYLKELVAKSDAILLKKLENGPANAKYTHHSIQDEILSAMSDIVLRRFKTEVDSAQCFALIVDESRDISKTEQLSVVVRCGIHLENCIAQTYDGASVMSGKSKGVQALLKLEVPQALYVHCFNHRLNLVIVDACKSFDSARTFFSLIEMLYVFLGGSATHALFITVQKQVCGTTIELKGISEIRWTCQINACKAVLHALPAMIVSLTKIAEGGRSRSAEARGILHQLNFTFVSHLGIFGEVLGELQILSDYLQNKNCDLTHAFMMESYRLCVIALTIPASSTACERTFSCLRRLKTYLRNRMSDKRLANLAVLAVEKTTAKSLELDDVVNAFDAAHHNRRIRLH